MLAALPAHFKAKSRIPDLLVVLLCVVVFIHGFNTTHDLEWGHDADHFRDVAAAQSILDGHFWDDPYYLGESMWYNPLVPSLIAVVARLTGGPVSVVHIRLGAYINLLAPISLYLLVASFFNRYLALASTAAFLFFASSPSIPTWSTATYSPFLYPVTFVQSLFYLTLLVYRKAIYVGRYRNYAATGLLLGLTFLGHTAPAVILGCIITLFTLFSLYRSRKHGARDALRGVVAFVILLGTALLVSAPYLATILGRYHLHIVNTLPTNWVSYDLELDNLDSFINSQVGWVVIVVVVLGLIYFLFSKIPTLVEKLLLVFWLLTCTSLLAYSYIQQIQAREGIYIPAITPGFHFLVYLDAFKAIMFGFGLRIIVEVAKRVSGRLRVARWFEPTVMVSLTTLCLWLAYPGYMERDYFFKRYDSLANAQLTDRIAAFEWVHQHTLPRDVFVARETLAMTVVGAAGRKVVTVGQFFSNPYVEFGVRFWDNEAMFNHLYAGDWQGFVELARRYDVGYVIMDTTEERGTLDNLVFLVRVYHSGSIIIYRAVFSLGDE